MWAALDAEFYLAFDAGEEACLGLVDDLKCNFLLLPTAYQEIADHCLATGDSELRVRGLNALTLLATYGIIAAPAPRHNIGMDSGLADDLVAKGIITQADYDSALILGEAACAKVDYLVTLDPVILSVNTEALEGVIRHRHLTVFKIISP